MNLSGVESWASQKGKQVATHTTSSVIDASIAQKETKELGLLRAPGSLMYLKRRDGLWRIDSCGREGCASACSEVVFTLMSVHARSVERRLSIPTWEQNRRRPQLTRRRLVIIHLRRSVSDSGGGERFNRLNTAARRLAWASP